ncbi:hypothetical protein [Methanomethylovorans sp.]|uniref:hypothetical protein n=1 Tax=Methanomethylovorans sp. TaxID=2758717 RepID=UPI00351C72DF
MIFIKRFQDTNERLRRLKNSFPFFKLYVYSSQGERVPYDAAYLAIDILTLLIEEGTLKSRPVPVGDIETHIAKVLKDMYPSQEYNSREVSRAILELMETDRNGSTYLFEHIDPIKNKTASYYVSLIRYNITTKGYEITEDGLDFMISTKELPEESRISVGLILFKKQIESHSFMNALSTVQELNLNVIRKKESKQVLLKKMLYGGADVREDFSKYKTDVFSQLKEEEELFEQVRKSLQEIVKNPDGIAIINKSDVKITEQDFVILSKITSELDRGYDLHSSLLNDFTSISKEYDDICSNRLNSLFDMRWRFREILESNIKMNRQNDVHVVEMQPLCMPKVPRHFSILKIFEPQIVSRRKSAIDETREQGEWTTTKLLDDEVKERQLNNFNIYAHYLLDIITSMDGEAALEDFLKHIESRLGSESLYNIDLLPFLLALNTDPIDKSPADWKVAYQTNFDLQRYDNVENENCELIESSLLFVNKELGLQRSNLVITSFQDSLIKVCKEKSIYVTDMKFVLR